MKPKSSKPKLPAEQVVKDIRRKTRRHFSAEDKIRIVLDGLRGDDSIAELCRREGIAQSLYYTWSKEFMEAGKRRLAGDTARAATTDEVKDLRREARDLKECVADLTLENRLLKKHDRGWGRRRMRYPASEKLEIIRIVEQSHLPAKRTLDQLGVARRTFYRWYDRYLEGGPEALQDRPSAPSRVWNRIGPEVQDQIVEMALEQTDLSPRELAVRFTDEKRYFVSEATVYRLLKAHDLITSPAYTVIKAAEAFHTQTSRPNEMWQTDFTYFKIIGWGWVYLSTVLDDYSRYIIAWKLCTTMRAEDVTDTLDMALAASGCNHANVLHRPRLLSDNGPSYIAGELAEYIEANRMSHVRGAPFHPQTQGKIERWHQTLKNRVLLENYFLPGDLQQQIEAFVEHYNHQRYHESLDNVTPADAYFGRAAAIIKRRERIKRKTLEHRRLQHCKLAA
ncbi:IS3 family transposase [Pacificimonas sp. ICDLI1SI03]|nr:MULTISPECIES: IS3 family transposase [Sphingomonadales]WRK94444.1 IS3 family transposase [Altererythrobacter sp. H2]WRK94500.1 IS3 family transposase [Altererythrobacter sp. H2]WRK94579.1 IS3 family transposase [Altererythrobacter sp. H2]WRK95370.1 IS3 family transposase [Altererythrobacter sp. H2]